mmetsp:Transcript_26432/g.91926  ORF Transcript_26432/g.91926 Transcript_26432/m.91926 type:complete len:645 (-) Transcript_26432:2074-4008(-)
MSIPFSRVLVSDRASSATLAMHCTARLRRLASSRLSHDNSARVEPAVHGLQQVDLVLRGQVVHLEERLDDRVGVVAGRDAEFERALLRNVDWDAQQHGGEPLVDLLREGLRVARRQAVRHAEVRRRRHKVVLVALADLQPQLLTVQRVDRHLQQHRAAHASSKAPLGVALHVVRADARDVVERAELARGERGVGEQRRLFVVPERPVRHVRRARDVRGRLVEALAHAHHHDAPHAVGRDDGDRQQHHVGRHGAGLGGLDDLRQSRLGEAVLNRELARHHAQVLALAHREIHLLLQPQVDAHHHDLSRLLLALARGLDPRGALLGHALGLRLHLDAREQLVDHRAVGVELVARSVARLGNRRALQCSRLVQRQERARALQHALLTLDKAACRDHDRPRLAARGARRRGGALGRRVALLERLDGVANGVDHGLLVARRHGQRGVEVLAGAFGLEPRPVGLRAHDVDLRLVHEVHAQRAHQVRGRALLPRQPQLGGVAARLEQRELAQDELVELVQAAVRHHAVLEEVLRLVDDGGRRVLLDAGGYSRAQLVDGGCEVVSRVFQARVVLKVRRRVKLRGLHGVVAKHHHLRVVLADAAQQLQLLLGRGAVLAEGQASVDRVGARQQALLLLVLAENLQLLRRPPQVA